MTATSTWTNDTYRFWGHVDCETLFLLFDTSAHLNGDVPTVSADEVLAHVKDCGQCRRSDVRVSENGDGFELDA